MPRVEVVAEGDHEHRREGVDPAGDEAEHVQRGVVGAVRVLDQQRGDAGAGELLQRRREDVGCLVEVQRVAQRPEGARRQVVAARRLDGRLERRERVVSLEHLSGHGAILPCRAHAAGAPSPRSAAT